MPELTPKDRLQPSLLDRLTDQSPEAKQESRDRRFLTMDDLKQSVIRDLEWLFNASNLASVEDLDSYPLVADSVINYGLPNLAGSSVSGLDIPALERLVRQAILRFEPRILRKTVKVRAVVSERLMSRNAVAFVIEGELWGQPLPLRLYLRTEVDLESGQVDVVESRDEG